MRPHLRKPKGAMLAMVIGTVLVVVAIVLFGLWYTQHTLNSTGHRTAIDSAALAAAAAVSRIVVDTDECGYVSLTGNAPTGKGKDMLARDKWINRVHSVNELLATARVDLIIADQLHDAQLRKLAEQDADAVKIAIGKLDEVLVAACAEGGSGTDIDGNSVSPYQDAISLYLSNPTLQSSFVPNSFAVTMGGIKGGIVTGAKVPVPSSQANLTSPDDAINGRYRSERDIKYGGKDFVFASVGEQVSLAKNFEPTIAGLPYQNLGAVKVVAKQKFVEQGKTAVQDFGAVATAGGIFVSPADGKFRVSFPDGRPPDCPNIAAMFGGWGSMSGRADVYAAKNGDYPGENSELTDPSWKPNWEHTPPRVSDVVKLAWYDWLRNCGSRVDVDQMVAMVNQPFQDVDPKTEHWYSKEANDKVVDYGITPTGNLHTFDITDSGEFHYTWERTTPDPYLRVAEGQLYAEGLDLPTSDNGWSEKTVDGIGGLLGGILDIFSIKIGPLKAMDCFVRDYVRERGHSARGKHAGEPLAFAPGKDYGSGGHGAGQPLSFLKGAGLPPTIGEQTDFALKSQPPVNYIGYTDGPSGGAPRPTYTEDGICSEVRFRRQIGLSIAGQSLIVGYRGVVKDPSKVSGGGVTPGPPSKGGSNGKKGKGKGGSSHGSH